MNALIQIPNGAEQKQQSTVRKKPCTGRCDKCRAKRAVASIRRGVRDVDGDSRAAMPTGVGQQEQRGVEIRVGQKMIGWMGRFANTGDF